MHTSTKAPNNKHMGKSGLGFLYPDRDPDHSQTLMGSKLDQDPSSVFEVDPICGILHNYANKQTNGHESHISLTDVIILS